jgi:hypothetical protein
VLVPFGETEPGCGFSFKVELDENGWFLAHDSSVVAGLNDNHLRHNEVAGAAVLECHVNLTAGEETHMGVHTSLGADVWLDVACPVKSDGIYGPLHAGIPSAHGIELNSAELAVLGAGNWCE